MTRLVVALSFFFLFFFFLLKVKLSKLQKNKKIFKNENQHVAGPAAKLLVGDKKKSDRKAAE